MDRVESARRFLFLQGHHSFFHVRLGDALRAAGHVVLKIRLSGQDLVYWPRRGAVSYHGTRAKWRAWLEAYLVRERVTDIIYYADRHPWHVDALAAAKARGLRAWAMEFGYLRPDFLTLEPEAMGAFSRFPRDPDAIRRLGGPNGDDHLSETPRYPHGFLAEAVADIGMYASTIVFWPFYPHYRLDLPYTIFGHYTHWIRTLITDGREERAALRVEASCMAEGADYTLLAMQIAQDYQIRASSHYDDYADMIEEVMASLARAAPPSRRLVVKLHPLDNGALGWRRRIPEMARRHGLEGRVDLIRGGDLGRLIRGAKGAVMANSTVGLHALRAGVSVKAMGEAIYDIPGLAHQGPLDAFWTAPEPVDAELEAAFTRALAREIQIKGSFFHRDGQARAVGEAVERLTARPFPDWAR